jgi:hypothetical protein
MLSRLVLRRVNDVRRRVVAQPRLHVAVSPLAADEASPSREAFPGETSSFECPLLGDVVDFGAGVEAVDGCRREQVVRQEVLRSAADAPPSVGVAHRARRGRCSGRRAGRGGHACAERSSQPSGRLSDLSAPVVMVSLMTTRRNHDLPVSSIVPPMIVGADATTAVLLIATRLLVAAEVVLSTARQRAR